MTVSPRHAIKLQIVALLATISFLTACDDPVESWNGGGEIVIAEIKQNPFRIVVGSSDCPTWLHFDGQTVILKMNADGSQVAGTPNDLHVGTRIMAWTPAGIYTLQCPVQATARRIVVLFTAAINE